MITLEEDYNLKRTIITIGNVEAARTTPRATPLITIQLKPPVMVQTYQQWTVVADIDNENQQFKVVLWTYQLKGKGTMTDTTTAHEVTRSGRCYAPEEVKRGNSNREQNQRRNITDAKAIEFQTNMSVKEYSIEEQLRNTPTHISIVGLLMSSDNHMDALVKVLIGVSVPVMTWPVVLHIVAPFPYLSPLLWSFVVI